MLIIADKKLTRLDQNLKNLNLALLIRELPLSATQDSIRESLNKYTGLTIQRIHISTSKNYALIQMKSMEDASYLLSTFNKVMPFVDNCAGFIFCFFYIIKIIF